MGIASGSTPTCSPSTNNSGSSDEPEFTFPPAIARSLSYRSISRVARSNAQAQYPFPPVVEGAQLQRTASQATVFQSYNAQLQRTASQATVVHSYGEHQPHPNNERRSSMATIRQSMAYLQAFEEPTYTPGSGGNNWTNSLATITAAPMMSAATQTPPVEGEIEHIERGGGLYLATTPTSPLATSVSNSSSDERSENLSLSRESSSRSARTPGSVHSVHESTPIRPTIKRAPSQLLILPVPLPKPPTTLAATRSESQKTITPASYQSSTENHLQPSPISPVPSSTPDETHSPHAHFAHTHHSHSHHHRNEKTSIHNTDASTCSWSTDSHEPDPRYDRLLFDYRVMAQSMHAYRQISIFRRFGRLSMANLLYYQDELTGIERALVNVDREETRWTHTGVSESESEKHELRETRVKLMRMLRETLKQYYEALLLQEQIFSSLDPPRPVDSRLLAALEDPGAPPGDSSPFSGAVNSDDLVALGLGGRDSLEKLVGRIIPAIFPHRDPSVEDLRHRNLSQKDVASILSPFTRRITRLVIALTTATLMLVPMVILQFMASDTWKLVCISIFTVVLALLVALATRGRGEAIVMVIAAYAAVLVVFVQGQQVVYTAGAPCDGGSGGAGGTGGTGG